MNIEIINSLKQRAKEMLENNYNRKIGYEEVYTIICELENFYTAYEKEKETSHYIQSQLDIANAKLVEEKEKNMELTNSYNQAIKETNEENRRCMLLAVENQDLKEKNKELEKKLDEISEIHFPIIY